MNVFKVTQIKKEDPTLIGKKTSIKHVSNILKPGQIIVDADDIPIVIFGKMDQQFDDVKSLLRHIKYSNNDRLTQRNNEYELPKTSYINFGYKPKRPVFGLAASACGFNIEAPAWYEKLILLGQYLQKQYSTHAPVKFQNQYDEVHQKVLPTWLMRDTIFTQGIVNSSNAWNYHFDQGNFKGFWSCMAVFRHKIIGGELVIPSLDLALAVEDHTYVLFNGQAHVHGVNEIEKVTPDAFRYSVVYYALQAMENCEDPQKELEKMRKIDLGKHTKNIGKPK